MNRYIHHKTHWFLGATLYACSSQFVNFLSLMRKSAEGDIQHRLRRFITALVVTVVLLIVVKNRAWRYGFLCVLVAQSLIFVAAMISATSTFGAIALAVLSFIPLIRALSFFLQFRRAENVEVYGGEYENKWTVWCLAGAVLLIVFLMFYLGSL